MDVRAAVVAWPADAARGAVTCFCEEHGVSRAWFYEVRKRARLTDAVSAMQPRVPVVSTRSPLAIPLEVEELAVRIRKELEDGGWDHGPVTVRHKLQQLGLQAPAASTLARVFARRGMVVPQPQKRPRSSYRRFEAALVHQRWQLDAFEWELTSRRTVPVYQVIDDRARAMLATYVGRQPGQGETAEDAIRVIDEAIAAYQVPQMLLTDNGPAFNQTRLGRRSRLVEHVEAMGCRAITGRPYHPQTQGKDERVHATTQRWLRKQPTPTTPEELQALLAEFDRIYNHHRPHQSLQMRTPARALRDGPFALPPLPPTPTAQPSRPVRAETYLVSGKGTLSRKRINVQLGTEYAAMRVTLIVTEQTWTIFDDRGELLRTLTLEPGRNWYPSPRPRGGRKRPRIATR